jgi:hypothetical protein
MLLEYAHPALAPVRRGAAALCAGVALVSGLIAVWCVVHTANVVDAHRHIHYFVCAEAVHEWERQLGVPVEKTIPVGLLCGGVAVVAAIQSARLLNGAKGS